LSHHAFQSSMSSPYVTREEFLDFLRYISAPIEDDKYYELIIKGVFRVKDEQNYSNFYAGQGRKEFNPRSGYMNDFHRSIYKGGSVSQNAPFGTSDQNEVIRRPQSALQSGQKQQRHTPQKNYPTHSEHKKAYQNVQEKDNFEQFRNILLGRGPRGYFGFAKHLRSMDKGDGLVDFYKLSKAAQDFRLDATEGEIEKAVEFSGARIGNGVDYMKFLKAVTGELNDYRRMTVNQFFERQDKDFKGYISTDLVYNGFNAKNHPDVKYGKRSEDNVLMEFLDTFAIHHQLFTNDPKGREKRVTQEEFADYYKVISGLIEDDKQFEFLISSCWTATTKGNLKGYYNPYHDNNSSQLYRKSFY